MSERPDVERRDGGVPTNSGGNHDPLEIMKCLWPEYGYRHDMVWKLVFRVTAVATALMIAPFLANATTQRALGASLVLLPIVAIFVIAAGGISLWRELKLLSKVRDAYRHEQDQALCKVPGWEPHLEDSRGFNFDRRVWFFLSVIFVAAAFYLILFIIYWLPYLNGQRV